MKAFTNELGKKALWVTLGTAAGIGAITGVRHMKKNKETIAQAPTVRKVAEFADKVSTTGSHVAASAKEDLSTVVDSVKTQISEVRHTAEKTVSPKTEAEPKEDETTTDTPKPVKAEDVVARTDKADAQVESEKNAKLKETKKEESGKDEIPTPLEAGVGVAQTVRAPQKPAASKAKTVKAEKTEKKTAD